MLHVYRLIVVSWSVLSSSAGIDVRLPDAGPYAAMLDCSGLVETSMATVHFFLTLYRIMSKHSSHLQLD